VLFYYPVLLIKYLVVNLNKVLLFEEKRTIPFASFQTWKKQEIYPPFPFEVFLPSGIFIKIA
jgi:hypothetical protein